MQHMVLSLSMRVRGGLSVNSLSEDCREKDVGRCLTGLCQAETPYITNQ